MEIKKKYKILIGIMLLAIIGLVLFLWGRMETEVGGSAYEISFDPQINNYVDGWCEESVDFVILYPLQKSKFYYSGRIEKGRLEIEVMDGEENVLCSLNVDSGHDYDETVILDSKTEEFVIKYRFTEGADGTFEFGITGISNNWDKKFRKKE